MVSSLERPGLGSGQSVMAEVNKDTRLETVYDLNKAAGTGTSLPHMLEQVIRMTQQTLNALAASILLFRDNNHELYFEAASGPVGKSLRQVKLSTQYGIAGQVARTGKPLIVNDVARSANFHKMMDDTTGFVTKSLVCAPLAVNGKILGVIEVLNKIDGTIFNEHDLNMVASVATTVAMAIENTRLYTKMQEAYHNTISALASAIDDKEPSARGHSRRVMEYTVKAGTVLCLTGEEMENLEYAGLLHDVGKISIDSIILNKPGSLNSEERHIIQTHPVVGADLLMEIPYLEKASQLVLYHHEKYDGKGYPNGIRGEDIPLGSRLIAVAEAFDTMTTDRVYRSAMSIEQAVAELKRCSGSQFCPIAVKALVSGLRLNPYR